MSDSENMEIEEPEDWEEPDDLLEEELELGEHRKASLAEAVKGFFTGLLFKSILVALILHVILVGLTSLGMFLKKPVPAEGENGTKTTESGDAKTEEKKTAETETKKEEEEKTTETTEKSEDNGEKKEETSTEDTTEKKEPKDKTKPTGDPKDYLKKLETIDPDKAPDNPLETKGDELE